MKLGKKIVTAVVAILILGIGIYIASPYLSALSLKRAVQSGNWQEVGRYVDFPAVRAQLKEHMKAQMFKAVMEDNKDNPFAALGVALAANVVDTMVDSLLTPEGLATFYEENSGDSRNGVDINGSLRWVSLSRVDILVQNETGNPLVLHMSLQGLKGWRVVSIDLSDLQLLS